MITIYMSDFMQVFAFVLLVLAGFFGFKRIRQMLSGR